MKGSPHGAASPRLIRRGLFPMACAAGMSLAAALWMGAAEARRLPLPAKESLVFLERKAPEPPPASASAPVQAPAQEPPLQEPPAPAPAYGTAVVAKAAPGLKPSDFAATSPDGEAEVVSVKYIPDIRIKSQKTEPAAYVALLMDYSSSLTGTDPGELRHPASASLLENLPSTVHMAVGAFGLDGSESVQLGPFTSDPSQMKANLTALQQIPLGSSTPLYDAVDYALEDLADESGAKHILCFTDGGDSGSAAQPDQLIEAAKKLGVKLHFIVLGQGIAGPLEHMAKETGGRVAAAEDAGSLQDAFDAVKGKVVEKEDHSRYEVTVRVTPRPGQNRSTHPVTLSQGGQDFKVQARTPLGPSLPRPGAKP